MKSMVILTHLVIGIIPLVTISGCVDSTHAQYRDPQTEEFIRDFYGSSREQVVITSVAGGSRIDAYCVLGPYESRLSDKDNLTVPANAFLEQIGLLGEEDYWHIAARSSEQFILIRINQRSTPLAPESTDLMSKSSCTVVKTLVIKKSGTSLNKRQTLRIGG